MALSPEQYQKLMSGIKLKARAAAAGIQMPAKLAPEERRLHDYIDSSNTQRGAGATAPSATPFSPGSITFAGAPRTLEESGLLPRGFELDDSQRLAVQKLVSSKNICLIGQAGTGKTTIVKYALAHMIYGSDMVPNPIGIQTLAGDQGSSIAVCAFTGIASQVVKDTLPPWLASSCKTIHQLLEYKPAGSDESGMFVPSRKSSNKLDHKVVIVDEASMLGLDLWHNLLDALKPDTKIILIGDLNQLKPVADATMFAYALSAGIDGKDNWDIAELTTIHRQKEAAANKIIEGATAILNGKTPVFDNPAEDPDWRFIGFELPAQAAAAHDKICGAVNWLRQQPTPGSPEVPLFDPYKDLLLCAGNGENIYDSSSFVQQIPLNGTLSQMIEPPSEEHPLYIIDAGRETKRFAVGHRVMATKNESPGMPNRVTNGLSGRVTKIESNTNWSGNRNQFGTETEVMAFRKAMVESEMGNSLKDFKLEEIDTSKFLAKEQDKERQASHHVTVQFVNGASRVYSTAPEVESIRLAYAITVHKAQGSQADTVMIVVHQAAKSQLSREWFYTGVTRARRRVIVMYTRLGLSTAVSRQQIFGKDLKEKVNRYRAAMTNGNVIVRLKPRAATYVQDASHMNS